MERWIRTRLHRSCEGSSAEMSGPAVEDMLQAKVCWLEQLEGGWFVYECDEGNAPCIGARRAGRVTCAAYVTKKSGKPRAAVIDVESPRASKYSVVETGWVLMYAVWCMAGGAT